jgi:hypothetical protein
MAAKKKAVKRVSHRPSPARPKSTKSATLPINADVVDGALFTTEAPSTVTVPRGTVQLFVKGRDYGMVPVNGKTIGEFGVQQARENGIRTFSLYADGVKVEPGDAIAKAKADTVAKLEVVPKDSRG